MLAFTLWESQKENRERETENLFEELMTESFPTCEREQTSGTGNTREFQTR